MNTNEILQRFGKMEQSTTSQNFEVITNGGGNRIVFRESARMVRGGRCLKCAGIGCVGLFAIMFASSLFSPLIWLLIPFILVGSWCSHWYVNRKGVSTQEQATHFEIDTQERKILIPPIPYKPQRHTELDIADIRAFYSWHIRDGDGGDYSVRCTYGKNEEVVVILNTTHVDIDQYARLLGFLCEKEVWKRAIVSLFLG